MSCWTQTPKDGGSQSPPNATVRSLTQVEVLFDEPVAGVDAEDLLVNGLPAASVTRSGGRPLRFEFPAVLDGRINVTWAAAHGITDLSSSALPFGGNAWSYTVDSHSVPGDLVINEFMAENQTGLKDEEGEEQDWIEIYNRGNQGGELEWLVIDRRCE